MATKHCIDGMIWIGSSYKQILCRHHESCGVPVKNKRNKCYVHEAEWRGCCRKVRHTPEWLVPGQSRIFLVHRDNLKSRERGKLFGYFVLNRIEKLHPPQRVQPLEVNPTSSVQVTRLEKLQEEKESILALRGNVYREDNGDPISEADVDAETLEGQCADSTATDARGAYELTLAAGHYRVTASAQGFESEVVEGIEVSLDETATQDFYLTPRESGSDPPDPDDEPDDDRPDHDDEPDDDDEPDPDDEPDDDDEPGGVDFVSVPIDATMFETHRSCSLRLKPGGVYLVDALTADVTDAFNRDIRKTGIWDRYSEATDHRDRKDCIEEGNQRFMGILSDFHRDRKTKAKIPTALEGMVELRGELVLFKDPPVYESHPQASFQGVRRIDGDLLLQQIANHVSVPTIPYYASDGPTQRDMIIAEISREFRFNQAASKRYFNKLIEIFTNELQKGNKLRLPGFGTFKVVHMKARKGRNPQTGEEINIPSRNTVRFSLAKRLRETVN